MQTRRLCARASNPQQRTRRGPASRLFVPLVFCSVFLCGCANAPREHFYALTPVAQAPETGPPAVADERHVSIGPVSIPEIVDRPQLVVRHGANQVEILEQHRWAQSLATDIAGVLAANLATLLPHLAVTTNTSPASAGADTRVGVEIVQFDAIPGEAVTVQARWSVRAARAVKEKPAGATLREPVRGPGPDALAAAFDRALARLSAEIADDLESASIFSGR